MNALSWLLYLAIAVISTLILLAGIVWVVGASLFTLIPLLVATVIQLVQMAY